MDAIYIPLFSALGGAIIGALAPVITVWIQTHYQSKRERLKLAVESALEDHRSSVELAHRAGRRARIPPVTSYMHYHVKYLDLLEKNRLNQEALDNLTVEWRELFRDADGDAVED